MGNRVPPLLWSTLLLDLSALLRRTELHYPFLATRPTDISLRTDRSSSRLGASARTSPNWAALVEPRPGCSPKRHVTKQNRESVEENSAGVIYVPRSLIRSSGNTPKAKPTQAATREKTSSPPQNNRLPLRSSTMFKPRFSTNFRYKFAT